MNQSHTNSFTTAIQPVCQRLRPVLMELPEHIQESVQEIRMRVNLPLSIFNGVQSFFVTGNGISRKPEEGIPVFREDMEETFRSLCSHSVYTHQNEIRNGFLTIRGRSQGSNFPPDNQGIFAWICRSALPLEFFFLSFFCSNLWALSIFMVAKGGQVT